MSPAMRVLITILMVMTPLLAILIVSVGLPRIGLGTRLHRKDPGDLSGAGTRPE